MPILFSGAVEGIVDEAVFRRLVRHVGAEPGRLHNARGRQRVLAQLAGFNATAEFSPWFVLVDLDQDGCAPPFRARHLPSTGRFMSFRVAVAEVESWLLADRERVSGYFRVPIAQVPGNPDALADPKRDFVNLCRRSTSNAIVGAMVPGERSGREVGRMYSGTVIDFIEDEGSGWRPDVAAGVSDSLARCLRDLRRVLAAAVEEYGPAGG